MTEYHGIDYGLGQSNIDKKSGIRYGVIPMNDLSEWAHESFEDDYGPPCCPKCGNEAVDGDSDRDESTRDEDKDGEEGELVREDYEVLHRACGDYACDDCRILFDGEDAYGEEPLGSYLDADGYLAERHSDGDVFILRSPYYTHAQFCSPCAPGACYLSSPVDESGPKAYCFAADWFDKDRPCPYPVFLVTTGECVYCPAEDEPQEPEEGDWTTEDFRTFREVNGRGIVEVKENKDWKTVIRARMEEDGFFPNVWRVSDHGNCEIVSME